MEAPLPTAGRKTQLFYIIFTEPGKVISEVPCTRNSCDSPAHLSLLPALVRRRARPVRPGEPRPGALLGALAGFLGRIPRE